MDKRRNKHVGKTGLAWIDQCLVMLVALLLVATVSVQALLFFLPQLGPGLNTALRLEGIPLEQGEDTFSAAGISSVTWATLTLELVDYVSRPEVKVLVNNNPVSEFVGSSVTISVGHGDLVTVSNPASQPVTVTVAKVTPNVVEPLVKSRVSGTGMLHLEPVVVK